jgi:acyl CoA:acetate/3-ketoacid CoA transferase alpha subunit
MCTRERSMRTKLVELSDAVKIISDGDEVVMSAGFTDSPMAMLREIARSDLKDLKVVGVVGGSINLDFLVGTGQAAVLDCCSIGFEPFQREAPNFDRYLKESRIYAMDNT